MRTNIGYIASRVLPFLFILSACNSEEEWSIPQPSGYLQIEGEIVGTGMATTKAKTEVRGEKRNVSICGRLEND